MVHAVHKDSAIENQQNKAKRKREKRTHTLCIEKTEKSEEQWVRLIH